MLWRRAGLAGLAAAGVCSRPGRPGRCMQPTVLPQLGGDDRSRAEKCLIKYYNVPGAEIRLHHVNTLMKEDIAELVTEEEVPDQHQRRRLRAALRAEPGASTGTAAGQPSPSFVLSLPPGGMDSEAAMQLMMSSMQQATEAATAMSGAPGSEAGERLSSSELELRQLKGLIDNDALPAGKVSKLQQLVTASRRTHLILPGAEDFPVECMPQPMQREGLPGRDAAGYRKWGGLGPFMQTVTCWVIMLCLIEREERVTFLTPGSALGYIWRLSGVASRYTPTTAMYFDAKMRKRAQEKLHRERGSLILGDFLQGEERVQQRLLDDAIEEAGPSPSTQRKGKPEAPPAEFPSTGADPRGGASRLPSGQPPKAGVKRSFGQTSPSPATQVGLYDSWGGVVCRQMLQNGMCNFGTNCRFSHWPPTVPEAPSGESKGDPSKGKGKGKGVPKGS